jgi:hypothetical protein
VGIFDFESIESIADHAWSVIDPTSSPVDRLLGVSGLATDAIGAIQARMGLAYETPIIEAGLLAMSAYAAMCGQGSDDGAGFAAGHDAFQGVANALDSASPTSEWEGAGADAYEQQNKSQQDRSKSMSSVDAEVQRIIAREAQQLEDTRRVLEVESQLLTTFIAPALLALAAPPVVGEAEFVAIQVAGVAATLPLCVAAMTRMAFQASGNAQEIQSATAKYQQIAASANQSGKTGGFGSPPTPKTRPEKSNDPAEKEPPTDSPTGQPSGGAPPAGGASGSGSGGGAGSGGAGSGGGGAGSGGGAGAGAGTGGAGAGSAGAAGGVPAGSPGPIAAPVSGTQAGAPAGAGAGSGAGSGMAGMLGSLLGQVAQPASQAGQMAGQVGQQGAQMAQQAAQGSTPGSPQGGQPTSGAVDTARRQEEPNEDAQKRDQPTSPDQVDSAAPAGTGERAPIHLTVEVDPDQVSGPVHVTVDPKNTRST